MSDKSTVTFESIVAGIANELCGEISTKFNPLKFKDKTIISSFPSQKHKDEYIEYQLDEIQNIINNTVPELQKYISHNILDDTIYSNNEISYKFLLNICNLYLIENHFDLINTYYNELIYTSDIFFGQNERYPGEDVYWRLFSDKHMINCNINDFIALVVSKIRQSFLACDFLTSEILKVENIEDKSINFYPSTNDNGLHKVKSEYVGEHDNLNLLIDTNVISNSPNDLKNDLDFPNANTLINFKISYTACSDLTKYFNYDNCADSTPSELYHWYNMSFRAFKDEVLTNLMSIPSDGKIPYLEKLGNLLDHDISYHNPDKSKIDALFKKYNTTEDEFINQNINDVNANNYFNDYITLGRDFRNGNFKLEVDHIHAEIFNYYGGIANNKAKEFIGKQLKQIDPSYTLLSEHKQNKINSLSIALGKVKKQTHEINYNVKYNSYKRKLSILLLKYYEYTSSGNVDQDMKFIKTLGYVGDNCIMKGDYCPPCIYDWLNRKLGKELCLKAMPFNSYKEKLDFILSHDELFNWLTISIKVDEKNHFTTFPQNEEESEIYINLEFELKERENKVRRLSGKKEINDVPIVSFDELKCNLYSKASKSPEPKLFLEYEYSRILNLFPKEKKSGIESIFWYMHHLKVNGTKHFFNFDDDYKSIRFVEYGPLAEHYINYYFYLKDIIENRQDAFIESTKYVDSDFIYFHVTSNPPLSQIEIDEIAYSGKYIVEISRPEPIPYIYNIINANKVLHNNFRVIIDFFMDTELWEFPIVKPEFKINSEGRKIRSEDPFNHRNHAMEVISFADTLPDLKGSLLTEYINLISDVNKHTPLISNLKSIIKMNISDKPIMAKEEKKKDKRNILEKFIFNINIHSESGKNVSIFKTNPFDFFNDIIPYYKDAKIYISSELRKIKGRINKELYLDELLTSINQLETFENSDLPAADDYLRPYNLSFDQLMASTDRSIPIVYEIGLSQEHINYHFQDTITNTEKFAQKATFVRLVPYHFKTKMIDYITGLKEKVKKDKNLKQQHAFNEPATTEIKDNEIAKLDAFNKFMDYFEYPYPYGYNIVEHYHHWKENLNYVKNEIETNLSNLETPKSNIYLLSLSRKLSEKRKNVNTTKHQLDKWYDKYNTNEEDALYSNNSSNVLHKSINSHPLKFKEFFDDDIDPDTDMIQQTFHNYHYGQFIDAALRFIDEVKLELNLTPSNSDHLNVPPNDSDQKKKTTRNPSTKVLSFTYKKHTTSPENLKNLYDRLKLKGFIKDDTALKDFKAVFSNTNIEKKISWHGNISELAYFIKVLHNEAKKVEDTKQKQWEITINIFVIPADPLPLTKDRLRGQKTPASSIKIEEAVNLL